MLLVVMATTYRVHTEGALSAPVRIVAADESSVVFLAANGVHHVNVVAGRQVAIALPVPGGATAVAASANTRLVAVADAAERPVVHLFRSGAATPASSLPGVPDLTVAALAVSRDGSLVAVFGSAPSFTLEQYSTSTNVPLRGSRRVSSPGLVTFASYCPGNKDRLAASGPSGLTFFLSRKSHESTETEVMTVPAPPGPVSGDTSLPRETPHESAHALLESAAIAMTDAAAAGLSATAGRVAQAEAGGQRGANVWTCHAWLDTDRVLACTVSGGVHLVSALTGAVLLSTTVAQLGVVSTAHASGSTAVVHAVAVTGQGVLLACTDGAIRVVTVSADSTSLALTSKVEVEVDVALTGLALLPSCTTALVTSAAGRVHRVSLASQASGRASVALLSGGHGGRLTAAVLLSGLADGAAQSAALTRHGSPLVTAGDDGSVRLWSAPSSAASAPGSGEAALALTAHRSVIHSVSLSHAPSITCLAGHSRLPLIAVGTSDGRVCVFLATTTGLTHVYEDAAHTGAVSALAWAHSASAALPDGCLVSASAVQGVLAVHAAGAMAGRHSVTVHEPASRAAPPAASPAVEGEEVGQDGQEGGVEEMTPQPVAEEGATVPVQVMGASNACLAFAALPPGSGHVTGVTWTSHGVALCTTTGAVLSLPSSALHATSGVPSDASAHLTVVGTLGEGVACMTCVRVAGGDVLVAAVVSRRRGGAGLFAFPALPSAGGGDLGGAAAHIPLSLPHGGRVVSVSVSPAACTGESCLLAVGATDGSVALLHVSLAGGGAGPPRVSTLGMGASTVHGAGGVLPGAAGVSWSPLGKRLVSVGSGDGCVALLSCGGDGCDKAEGGPGLPKGLPLPGTPLGAGEAALLSTLAHARVEEGSGGGSGGVAAVVRPVYALLPSPSSLPPGHSVLAYPAPHAAARVRLAGDAAVAEEHASARSTLLGEVAKFRSQLASLLSANEGASHLERMPRTDFTLDALGREAMEDAFEGVMTARAGAYAQEFRRLDVAIARVRGACVESMESLASEVRGMHTESVVKNFPLPKRSAEQARMLQQYALMRTVELAAIGADAEAEHGGRWVGVAVWSHLTSLLPTDCDWLVHAGLLAPTTDPAAQLEALFAAKEKGAAAPPAAAGGSASSLSSAGSSSEGGEVSVHKEGKEGGGGGPEDDSLGWEGEAVSKLIYHPASVRTPSQKRAQVAFLKELLRATRARFNASLAKLCGDKGDLVEGIRTRHARIASILTDLGIPCLHTRAGDIRAAHLSAYTAHYVEAAALVAGGLDHEGLPCTPLPPFTTEAVDAVAAGAAAAGVAAAAAPPLPTKSLAGVLSATGLPLGPTPTVSRGRTPVGPVLMEAHGVMTLTDPYMAPSEVPMKALVVGGAEGVGGKKKEEGAGAGAGAVAATDPELMLAPFVSEAERRRKAEEEGKARSQAANKDDAPDRALMDMFNGRLAGKDELTQMAEGLAQLRAANPFLDPTHADYMPVTHESITAEQKTEWERYKASLQGLEDEKSKVRNALLSELVKLTGETRDLVAAFDEKVASAAKVRTGTAACIAAVEHLCARLALSVQVREDGLSRDAGMEGLFNARLPMEAEAAVAHESFLAAEAGATSALDAAKDADRAVERNLRAELTGANGGEPLDSDLWKVLTTLFKKRWPVPPPIPPPTAASGSPAEVDPFAWADLPVQTVEARAGVVRDAAVRPLTDADVPDGYGSALLEKPALWAALQRTRLAKIETELRVSDAAKRVEEARGHRAYLAAAYNSHKEALDGWDAARRALSLSLDTQQADAEFLVRLKAGQDEASQLRGDGSPHPLGGAEDTAPILLDSVLVPGDVIEAVNADVRKLGGESVAILQSIRDFRKGLLLLGWEFGYARAARADAHGTYRDLQIMRAAGIVKEYVVGVNVAAKARDDVVKAEAKLEHTRRTHARNLAALHKSAAKLESTVGERVGDVDRLGSTRADLEEAVSVREGIFRARRGERSVSPGADVSEGGRHSASVPPPDPRAPRTLAQTAMASGGGGGGGKPDYLVKAQLTAKAKAQVAEMGLLREELSRLEKRNFPSLGGEHKAPF